MDRAKFTVLDDTPHVIGEDETTVCGLPVPFGNGYVTDRPAKVCAECAEKALGETPTGKPKDTDETPLYPSEPEPVPVEVPKPKAKAASGSKA